MTEVQTHLGELLEPYGPRVPLARLVVELNKLYHRHEAAGYDRSHPEISRQLPELWQEMLRQAVKLAPARPWRVLDFGCGTGFEAEQLITTLGAGQVAEIVCYDLSAEMLLKCRRRLADCGAPIRWCDRPEEIEGGGPFDVVLTNSLLHHLPDPVGAARGWLSQMTAGAVWLAGHEPSSRFYNNQHCRTAFEQFTRLRRWSKYFSPPAYLGRARRMLRIDVDPASVAAQEAWRDGLFSRRPPALLVSRIVDFHVAHSHSEAQRGRGFDVERLRETLAGAWNLRWVKSYAFMGPFYESNLPHAWRRRCQELQHSYPRDGANFSGVWTRA